MTRVMSRKNSIYVQLLKLLLGSAATALFIFFTINYIGDYMIDFYCDNSEYINKRDQYYVKKLQRYINQHQLSSRAADEIYIWVKTQKVISVRIYKDDIQIFDTEYPDQELWGEDITLNEYEWEKYYFVTFMDGKAKVTISGMYAYQFYNYALIIELIIAFSLFLLFVILGIRAKMNYIRVLSNEIEILEGGSLDYEITVKGKDELTALAEGLNSMRLSFQSTIDQEIKIVQENQKIVTEMSHDLRTPVTSILLYTEILKKGRYKDETQLKEYLEKIDRKACRMKQLTDHLFEYSLVTGETGVVLEEPETFEVLFYDLFSETCSYLEQRGFQIGFRVEWESYKIQVYTDYVIRIMDNITSNIIKYADKNQPILIQTVSYGHMAGFSFTNTIKPLDEKAESTYVGLQSIKSMMMKMKGNCTVQQESGQFNIELVFPLCD